MAEQAQIIKNYQAVTRYLENYPQVTLIAVSKRQPMEKLRYLVEEGHRDFGENYVQEWESKKSHFPSDLRWHFIGQLQSKKLNGLIRNGVHCIHSIGSESAFEKIQRMEASPPWMIQVNLAGEDQKGGLSEERLEAKLSTIQPKGLCGLMCIPPIDMKGEPLRQYFKTMRKLCDQYKLEHLSMGMSSDWQVALDEGSTMIRLGSSLFGQRLG